MSVNPLPSVQDQIQCQFTLSVGPNPITGLPTPSPTSQSPGLRRVTLSSSAPNSTAFGCDTAAIESVTIAANTTFTVNLKNYTDPNGNAGQAMAHVKGYYIENLSTANGGPTTPATSVTVGGGSNPCVLDMGGTVPVFNMLPGDLPKQWATNSPTGIAVSNTTCNVLITNNDLANAAQVLYKFDGCTT
jgi:hypothetical protein